MTTNPFDAVRPKTENREMEVGETRYVCARNTKGEIVKEYTLTRTARPYVYDLCDAYNNSMSEAARQRGAIWIVTHGGELKLTDSDEFHRWNTRNMARKGESERQEWLRNHRKGGHIPE